MSIQVNTGANAVNWEAILSALGDVQKTEGTDGREAFTITTRVDGETRTMTVAIPDDLEIPENVDATTLSNLVTKLESSGLGFTPEQIAQMKDAVSRLYNESAKALNEVQGSGTVRKATVLYDIYALMSLMIDVAQSQRDASREMRTAENLAIQKSIQDQADQQRQAAVTGMIVGIVCGVAAAAVSAGLMVGQTVSAKMQSNIMKQSGADASTMQSQMIQNSDTKANAHSQLTKTEAKVGEAVKSKVEGDFGRQLVDDQAGNLKTNLDKAVATYEGSKLDLTHKEANVEGAKATLGGLEGEKINAQRDYDAKCAAVTDAEAKLATAKANEAKNNSFFGNNVGTKDVEAAQAKLDQAKTEQATAKAALDDASKKVSDQTEVVASAQRDLGNAHDKVKADAKAVAQARSDYQKTVNDVAAQYKEKYQKAVDALANPPKGADKAQLEANVKTARAEMEMAFAKQADLLAQDNVMTPSEQKDLVQGYRVEADNAMQRVYQRTDFKGAERRIATLAGWNTICQAMGNTLQTMGQNWSSMLQANATQQGAETTKEEEMLDQTKDLFSQEQKLIDQVVQLCQAVIQAESQSMRDAIQA